MSLARRRRRVQELLGRRGSSQIDRVITRARNITLQTHVHATRLERFPTLAMRQFTLVDDESQPRRLTNSHDTKICCYSYLARCCGSCCAAPCAWQLLSQRLVNHLVINGLSERNIVRVQHVIKSVVVVSHA